MSHYITCHNCGEPECMDSDTGVHRRDDGTVCPDPRDAVIEGLRAEVERLTRERDEATQAERARCLSMIPTSWLDPMFVDAPKTLNCKSVEWVCAKIAAALRGDA